jgi:hypothetical protein
VTVAILNGTTELVIVAVALEWAVESAALEAVTVTDFALVLVGAVNSPLADTLPALADQVTAVLLVLLTTAANCSFPPATTEGSAGVTCTLTELTDDFEEAEALCGSPAQPSHKREQPIKATARTIVLLRFELTLSKTKAGFIRNIRHPSDTEFLGDQGFKSVR